MIVRYEDDLPLIEFTIIGNKINNTYKGYLDTGSTTTSIPKKDAIELGLEYAGQTYRVTSAGIHIFDLYKAKVSFVQKEYELIVIGLELHNEFPFRALIGRDLLDHYKTCFDGINGEIIIEPAKFT